MAYKRPSLYDGASVKCGPHGVPRGLRSDVACLAAVSGICSALTQELSVSPSFPALGCNNLALCNVSGDTPAYMFFAQIWEFKLVIVSHVFKRRFEERVLQQCGWGGVFATL